MKITADKGPDDWRRKFANPVITVDGVRVNRVVEVDTDVGYVDRVATDAHGKLLHDGETITIERLQGRVEVREAN